MKTEKKTLIEKKNLRFDSSFTFIVDEASTRARLQADRGQETNDLILIYHMTQFSTGQQFIRCVGMIVSRTKMMMMSFAYSDYKFGDDTYRWAIGTCDGARKEKKIQMEGMTTKVSSMNSFS